MRIFSVLNVSCDNLHKKNKDTLWNCEIKIQNYQKFLKTKNPKFTENLFQTFCIDMYVYLKFCEKNLIKH